MCRHLAWLGAPRTLAALLVDPEHSLLRQSYAPREQAHGRLNADGFGAGWYAGGHRRPARYRRAQPMWTDTSFASLAHVVASGAVLAAVRAASPGMPLEESATAPFTAGRWLFSHNGTVHDFPRAQAALRRRLPEEVVVESAVDSALVWALVRARLQDGAGLADALAGTVADVLAVTDARLNLLLADGERVAATVCGDTLAVREDDDGVLVASEPTDDRSGWRRLGQGSLLAADPDGLRVERLEARR